jgi:hypothetical protein
MDDKGPPPSRVRPFLPAEPVPVDDAPTPTAAARSAVSGLRPYLLTGGRVDATHRLQIESQVVTTETGSLVVDKLTYEQRDIVRLCTRRPLAIAEVAAHLGLHLGVARVLAGDLVELGYLAVQQTRQDVGILERVIRGLESIR